jgi:hypothetical protein
MYLVLHLLSKGIGLDCLSCLSLSRRCTVSTEGKDEGSSKDPGSSRKAKRRMKHLIFGPDPDSTLNDRPTDRPADRPTGRPTDRPIIYEFERLNCWRNRPQREQDAFHSN